MKKILTILIILFSSFSLKSQISLQLGLFYKAKFEVMNIMIPNNELKKSPTYSGDNFYVISAGISIKRFEFELNYSNGYYTVRYDLKKEFSKYRFAGVSNLVEYNGSYGIGFNYFLMPMDKKINILPGIGVIYTKGSSSYSSSYIKKIKYNGDIVVRAFVDEQTKVSSNFYLMDTKLDFIYKPFYYFTGFIRIGYQWGVNTMGSISGWYEIDDKPRKFIKNSTKGTNLYLGIGIKVSFNL